MVTGQQMFYNKTLQVNQVLEYCIRLSSEEDRYDVINSTISAILTFGQLKNENVTAEKLIEWSIPVDIIERYQEYLDTNSYSSTEFLYNCTEPWFGTNCQYRFPLKKTFSGIVYTIFNKRRARNEVPISTCYIHMKCDRGSSLLCLDWREICDGKVDCIDGGEDEKYCQDLYTNECGEVEYQCRNRMCIDIAFLLGTAVNSVANFECLDTSNTFEDPWTISFCEDDPSFRCEEILDFHPQHFHCGDGSSTIFPLPDSYAICRNGRYEVFNYKFGWHNQSDTRFPRCFKIALCASKNYILVDDYDRYCVDLCGDIEQCKMSLQHCPSYIFAPNFPVYDGHLRLGYFTNQTITNYITSAAPHFICFDQKKCPFLIPSLELDNYTCLHTHILKLSSFRHFYDVFISCIHRYENIDKSNAISSMFHCIGTKKYIPRHHIMDGIPDCYGAFDESVAANSCAVNDQYRFRCTSEDKCLLPFLINDGAHNCIGKEDESFDNDITTRTEKLPFSAICDGKRDIFSSARETDETHCDFWPCVNQYTRCNRGWTCLNGMDEINCPSRFNCPRDHHPCVLFKNNTVSCLHISRINDGIIDCLGSADERAYCRLKQPDDIHKRYRCWNDTKCVDNVLSSFLCDRRYDYIDTIGLNQRQIGDIDEYESTISDIKLLIKRPFSLLTSHPFPKQPILSPADKHNQIEKSQPQRPITDDSLNNTQIWFCNRGILIYSDKNQTEKCLCPPSYYGNRCQYQSERISLTVLLRNEYFEKFTIIAIVITLVDNNGLIHSYEQITHIPTLNCNTKYNIYLLYQDRPKDQKKNYTIYIDAYDKINLMYLASLMLPVKLLFMPVNRFAVQLTIPMREYCQTLCKSKDHQQQASVNKQFCRCQSPKTMNSIDPNKCNCSPDSICVGKIYNQSICICPLSKNSPRCFLKSICHKNSCLNEGRCIPVDHRISFNNFKCVCQDGFSGVRCEQKDVSIDISFVDIPIPQYILVHFITLRKYEIIYDNPIPVRATMFQKIGFYQEIVTFYMSLPFHMVFSQIEAKYYLTVLQHNFTPSVNISTVISPTQYCPHIRELFNKSIIDYEILRQVKYYHLPCMEKPSLLCFHDDELFMCLCTNERHANCFHFDFNMTYDCAGSYKCENQAQCFQDSPSCPSKVICVCRECFYGTLCQLSTEQFGLSLDSILGYQIRPHVSISGQTIYVKISIVVASLMLIVGVIFGSLSVLTFQSKTCQKVGCGRYLLASSIISVLTVINLNFKLWLLILSQMSVIISRNILLFDCMSNEFILRSLLALSDWYNAAVAIERLITVILNVNFNLMKSKRVAKFLTFIIPPCIFVSFLHDPIHRHLIDDEEEKRTWCLIRLTSNFQTYNSFINIFHFIVPFILKVISSIGIIFFIAKRRSKINKEKSFLVNVKEQFYKHQNLLISSSLLVGLALPRLILAFSSGCMKSEKEPTLFLIGYFISFVPSLLTFFIFVLTSKTYNREFKRVWTRNWMKLRLFFS